MRLGREQSQYTHYKQLDYTTVYKVTLLLHLEVFSKVRIVLLHLS